MEKTTSFEDSIVAKFEEFVNKEYIKELTRAINAGKSSLVVDFAELEKFVGTEITDYLLENPRECIPLLEEGLRNVPLAEDKKIKVRIKNLPKSATINIRDIRSKHLGKLIAIEGIIRQTSDVRPVATSAIFECPSCGNLIEVPQNDRILKEPTMCSCGRKGKFRLVSKKLVDTQRIVVEEMPEKLETDAQPKRISVFLTDDMVDPKIEKWTRPGSKVNITGIVKEIPIIEHGGMKTTRFDLVMDANYVEPIEYEFEELEITPEDEKIIKEMAKDPEIDKKLVRSIAPSIYGYEKIKEAIVLQLFGGVRTKRPDNTVVRGDIHILLIGDPGVAKTQLLKYVAAIAPKARYVSGKGASGAGITATVVRDEFLKGWSLEAGALVLAHKGIALIDEIDKMGKEDRSALHEGMEQQTITISKANIHATLKAETTILAAANPKLGRFDPYYPIPEQIDLPPTLISRFDLIFPIRDIASRERDTRLARHILSSFQKPEELKPEIDPDLMRKYIAYAKKHCKPKLSDEALETILNYFVELRNKKTYEEEEGRLKPMPISARQLEALVRLAQASAKIRLRNVVLKEDAERAIGLLNYCMQQVGIDTETGELDIDRIYTGIPSSTRNKMIIIRELINELEEKYGKNIPLKDLIEAAKERGIEERKTEEIIERMRREGEIFDPRPGVIRKMPK